ncbi:MAG TPA: GAF domain-containing protein [Thermoanaerobaculia bacterium]
MAGFDGGSVEACLRQLGPEIHVLVAGSAEEALRLLGSQPVAVLAVGAGVAGERARGLIEDARDTPGAAHRVNLVLAGGPDPSLFQDLIDSDSLFYLSQEPVPPADLIALLRGAANRWRATVLQEDEEERRRSSFGQRLLAAAQAINTQQSPAGATRAAADAVEDLASADRGYCLLFDPSSDTLWEGARPDEEDRRESAAVGLVSFVVRTGIPISLERIAADPRFDRDADDPRAEGEERFVAAPVTAPDGRVVAVLAAVRGPQERPFDDDDLRGMSQLAEQAAPTLARLRPPGKNTEGLPSAMLFREEAVEYHQVGVRSEGDLLRVDPGWMRWTYRLLLGAVLAGLLFSVLAPIREYASGPAMVRLGGRSDLTATTDGTVTQVMVAPGERVAAGRLLVRFYGAREAAELRSLDQEFEAQLINRLRNPADRGAEQSLIVLRAQMDLARARLAEREMRAPTAGVVGDIRVRPGQHITPGQTLLSLSRGEGRPEVTAWLPGEYRPMLKPGMRLRLELRGYRYAYQHLTVNQVDDKVVGPTEAQRSMGQVADAVQLDGPVVRVTARLEGDTFEAEGRTRRYHDGMLGQAEVSVRSEKVLVALIPALKAVFEREEAGDA